MRECTSSPEIFQDVLVDSREGTLDGEVPCLEKELARHANAS